MLTTIMKSFDTIGIIARTSNSITLRLTGIGLIVIPISICIACGLSISNKVIFEIVIQYIINTINNMKKINQQTNPFITFTKKVYNIM